MSIKVLPPDVQSKLRSGVAITCPRQCVEELILNSLDAGATCIAVRVDLHHMKIQVVDNGSGITYEQLKLLGERYATSKCHSLKDLKNLEWYGFRGEAIASIRDVSGVVEIVTKSEHEPKTYCKIFSHGKEIQIGESKVERPSLGATFTVYNFLYNLPVRRKNILESLDLEDIRTRIESIALIHPDTSFSLRNDLSGVKCLQTTRCDSILTNFANIFGLNRAENLRSIRKEMKDVLVEGYVSTQGFHNKNLQFVYVNKRLVLKTQIHKIVNSIFGKFGKNCSENCERKKCDKYPVFVLHLICPFTNFDVCFEPSKTFIEFKNWHLVCTCVERAICDVWMSTREKKLEKEIEKIDLRDAGEKIVTQDVKHALMSLPAKRKLQEEKIPFTKLEKEVFREKPKLIKLSSNLAVTSLQDYVNKVNDKGEVKCKLSKFVYQTSNAVTPKKTFLPSSVTRPTFKERVVEFSKRKKMISNVSNCIRCNCGAEEDETLENLVRKEEQFQSNIKQCETTYECTCGAEETVENLVRKEEEFQPNMKICDAEEEETVENLVRKEEEFQPNVENNETLENDWVTKLDLQLGKNIYIHKKSGNSSFTTPPVVNENNVDEMNLPEFPSDVYLGSAASAFKSHKNVRQNCEDQHLKWKCTERHLLDDILANLDRPTVQTRIPTYNVIQSYKFTRDMLQHLKVINQIDAKFIACSFQNGLIVLFDQHAVHERIRLEQLQADFQCENEEIGVKTCDVNPPMDLTIRPNEIRIVRAFLHVFARWGFQLSVNRDDQMIVRVHTLPQILAERQMSEAQRKRPPVLAMLVLRILEDIITHLKDSGSCTIIPESLIEILHSQACKGAIKFGDSLSRCECEDLIKLLQNCHLPFQCAHGRPTIYPLFDLNFILPKGSQMGNRKNWIHKRRIPRLWRLQSLQEL